MHLKSPNNLNNYITNGKTTNNSYYPLIFQVYSKRDCRSCKPGYYAIRQCNEVHDTVCAKCPTGSYTPEANIREQCIPCSKCDNGHFVLKRCTSTEDSTCRSCDDKKYSHIKSFRIVCDHIINSMMGDAPAQNQPTVKTLDLEEGSGDEGIVLNENKGHVTSTMAIIDDSSDLKDNDTLVEGSGGYAIEIQTTHLPSSKNMSKDDATSDSIISSTTSKQVSTTPLSIQTTTVDITSPQSTTSTSVSTSVPSVTSTLSSLSTKVTTTTLSTTKITTEVPSTAAPSIVTTEAPSTVKVTTEAPSTVKVTTAAPSTVKVTTAAPSTTILVTEAPSTTQKSTEAPSTAQLTTTTTKRGVINIDDPGIIITQTDRDDGIDIYPEVIQGEGSITKMSIWSILLI